MVLSDCLAFLPKDALGDLTQEIERRKKELEDKTAALARAEAKLLNEKFMSGAPEAVRAGVIKTRDDLLNAVSELKKYLDEMQS